MMTIRSFYKIKCLVLFGVFFVACERDLDNEKSTIPNLDLYGEIDSALSFHSQVIYALKGDKRKCKSWGVNVFSGRNKWSLNEEIEVIRTYPEIQSNSYSLSVPLSQLDKYSDCQPEVDSIKLCVYERSETVKECVLGLYAADKTHWCFKEEIAEESSCREGSFIFEREKNDLKLDFNANSATVSCLYLGDRYECLEPVYQDENLKQDGYRFNIKVVSISEYDAIDKELIKSGEKTFTRFPRYNSRP